MSRLVGKRALVTGAGGGIGAAVAAVFAEHGAALTLWDVDAPGLEVGPSAVLRCVGEAESRAGRKRERERERESERERDTVCFS